MTSPTPMAQQQGQAQDQGGGQFGPAGLDSQQQNPVAQQELLRQQTLQSASQQVMSMEQSMMSLSQQFPSASQDLRQSIMALRSALKRIIGEPSTQAEPASPRILG